MESGHLLFISEGSSVRGIVVNQAFFNIFCDYKEITIRYDAQHRAIWCYFNPSPRPCFSLAMLGEMRQVQKSIISYFKTRTTDSESPIRYLVIHSKVPGIYNLGGDLALFCELIIEKDRLQLLDYARQCIEIVYFNNVSMHLPITTISLVEGLALGGGFESALSSNILIATENAEMGFPEIRFNLIPGMGAYSFLARTCGMAIAQKIMANGKIYLGKELHEMGIVHHLVEADSGQEGVEKFIRHHQRSGNGHRALQQVRQSYHPLDFQELADVIEIWVDAALQLKDKDLRLMERLAKAQTATMSKQKKEPLVRTKQDRRFTVDEISFPLTDWSGETIMVDRRKKRDRRLFH